MRYNPNTSNNLHIVNIAVPSWNHMNMYMSGQTGTCATTDIHPDIHPLRIHGCVQESIGVRDKVHQAMPFLFIQITESCNMSQRSRSLMENRYAWPLFKSNRRLQGWVQRPLLALLPPRKDEKRHKPLTA